MSININKVSVQWGYWATPRYEGEYPRVSAGFAELKCDARYLPKYRVQPITDDLGMQIDGHMQVMKRVSPELYDVFMLTYVKRWDNIDICRHLNLSRREYFQRLKTAKTSLLLMIECQKCIFVA
nr:MAG TPA: DNA-directed RNA polymerase subunit alpha [Caudoviricetes sp.]